MFKRRLETHQEQAFVGSASAREYAEIAQKSTMRYRAFLSNIKSLNIQGKYLDVGAGTGNVAAIIAQSNPDVKITALEISPDMITVGKDYIDSKDLQGRIRYVVGDAMDEGFSQGLGGFDLIYSTYALHHWEDPRKVIDNLMSSLTDFGVLYLYDLRRVWWLYWVPVHNGFFNSIRAAYVRGEIKEMLEGLRLECYDIKNEFPFMQSIIIRKP